MACVAHKRESTPSSWAPKHTGLQHMLLGRGAAKVLGLVLCLVSMVIHGAQVRHLPSPLRFS
jgi:hypothetical protein